MAAFSTKPFPISPLNPASTGRKVSQSTEVRSEVSYWRSRLNKGERLAWAGRPGLTIIPDKTAFLFSVPAAMACLGILAGSESQYVSAITATFGVPALEDPQLVFNLQLFAVATLAYLAVYLYSYCVVSPRFTRYALTDRRALIRTAFPWPRTRSKRLTPGTEIVWDQKNPGTILFDEVEHNYGVKPKSGFGTAPTVKTCAVGFHRIAEAEYVHGLMQEVAHGTAPGT